MNKRSLVLLSLAVLFTSGFAAGGQQGPAAVVVQAPTLQTPHPRYQLRPGDTFDISFRYTPEFNQTVTVQPDGFINLRDLPDMYVAGRTSPELVQSLTRAYSSILHEPAVTVSIKDFEKPYFIASGELGRPGKYELRGDTTVVQAVAIAGGFTERSKHSQVLLFRRLSDQWTEVKTLDIKQMLKTPALTEDLHLRPGDLVYVPKNFISKITRLIPTANVGVYANPIP